MPSSHDRARWTVSGRVELPHGFQWPTGASLRLRIEDVSRADAPASIVAEHVIRDVQQADLASGSIPFSVDVSEPDPRAAYAVRAHLDVDGDGAVTPGDYVSTVRIPVLTDLHQGPVRIAIRRVG